MKVYSIGREAGCDIVINDRTDVISRRHAVLTVMPSGKMTITDHSQNGTYVNGIRITSDVPVPVTRKDNVSLAHVARLDWNLIPNPQAAIMRWAIIGVVAALLLVVSIIVYNQMNKQDTPIVAVPDSGIISREEMENRLRKNSEEMRKHLQDSIRRDSLKKDSIQKIQQKRKEEEARKKKEQANQDKKKKSTPAKEEPKKEPKPRRVR